MSASTAPPSSGPQVGTKERITASSSQAPGSTTRNRNPTPEWVDTLLFWLDWAIKVLGVAAAVVFGIWAPLSFQAANDASASGDATQSSVMSAVNSVNGQASSALRIQSSAAAEQSIALDAMNSRIGAIGQLSLLDFCLRNIELAACESFTSVVPFTSLVSYLASATDQPSTSASPSSTTTGANITPGEPTETSGSNSGSASHRALSLPAILGIVFAAILFLGVVAGIFVSRLKRLRSRQYDE